MLKDFKPFENPILKHARIAGGKCEYLSQVIFSNDATFESGLKRLEDELNAKKLLEDIPPSPRSAPVATEMEPKCETCKRYECAICSENFVEKIIKKCGHAYCAACCFEIKKCAFCRQTSDMETTKIFTL